MSAWVASLSRLGVRSVHSRGPCVAEGTSAVNALNKARTISRRSLRRSRESRSAAGAEKDIDNTVVVLKLYPSFRKSSNELRPNIRVFNSQSWQRNLTPLLLRPAFANGAIQCSMTRGGRSNDATMTSSWILATAANRAGTNPLIWRNSPMTSPSTRRLVSCIACGFALILVAVRCSDNGTSVVPTRESVLTPEPGSDHERRTPTCHGGAREGRLDGRATL
jgi:hypothetical protein